MNILKEADKIVNERSEEKDREYGPFSVSMERMCELFNVMTANKYNCTPEDMYIAMIALKLSRESHKHKRDNLLDTVAYIGALDNYINEKDK